MNVRKTAFSPTLTAYWVLELHISLRCENSCCGIIMCRLLPYNSIVLCDKFIYLFFFFLVLDPTFLQWFTLTQSHQRYNTGGVLFVYAGVLVSSSLIFPVTPVGGSVGDSLQCYTAGPGFYFSRLFLLLSFLLLIFLLLDFHPLAGIRS